MDNPYHSKPIFPSGPLICSTVCLPVAHHLRSKKTSQKLPVSSYISSIFDRAKDTRDPIPHGIGNQKPGKENVDATSGSGIETGRADQIHGRGGDDGVCRRARRATAARRVGVDVCSGSRSQCVWFWCGEVLGYRKGVPRMRVYKCWGGEVGDVASPEG